MGHDPRDDSTDCPFCAIAAGEVDQDLIVLRTDNVVVVPTLKQRPANQGQVIVLPTTHATALHSAEPALLAELFQVVTRITAAAPAAFDAAGTTVFQNNNAPDQILSHLHIHIVPRSAGDDFVMPNPSTDQASRRLRIELAARLRQVLTEAEQIG